MAIDTARAYVVKTRLGAALDAAALAVGSKTSETSTQLTTDLKNYFYNNYCKAVPTGPAVTSCSDTMVGETNVSVTPTTSITGAVVTYQATATIPMVFMQLVGINNITVGATTQTTKFPGMEIAVVLDNTGSMLCNGPATGPAYSNCNSPSVTSDTACSTLGTNPSRICTLIQAANQFVTTLVNAQTGPQQLYMSIVPYVTNVNVGSAFGCTNGSTTCSHIASSGGVFTDLRGYMMPVVLITGYTTGGNNTISNVSMAAPAPTGTVSGNAAVQQGMAIYGPGIPSGTTVSNVTAGGTSITISQNATLSFNLSTNNTATLVVGPTSAALVSTPFTDPTAVSTTGSWANNSPTVTVASTSGILVGMVATSSSSGIPTSTPTTVTAVNAGSVTLSANATVTQNNKTITFSLAGTLSSGSKSITSMQTTNTIVPGMLVTDAKGSIPANSYVTAVNSSTQITLSAAATASQTSDVMTFTSLGGNTTNNGNTITGVSTASVPTVGTIITGNGIPVNTTVTAAPSTAAQYLAGTGTLTISNNATATNNTTLHFFNPLTYDTAYNSASPAGSSTTTGWGGCVVEPTSSGENASGTGVLAVSGNPDTSEPVSGTAWYPFWWANDSTNTWWVGGATNVKRQDTTTEIQGQTLSDWLKQYGPNQGCPVPILPLTDLTTTAGQNTVTNTINSMWPRDEGGTQVHVGMIWGWRALSPNGPFTANNGHPLAYDTAQNQGWKKIIVLMTDGTEEWPASGNLTGLGQIADGKINTTSAGTAPTNLDTRLQTICTNLLASTTNGKKDYMIFTIGLGYDGQHNATLKNWSSLTNTGCAGNGGAYYDADPSTLTTVFQSIANSIIHLRLSR